MRSRPAIGTSAARLGDLLLSRLQQATYACLIGAEGAAWGKVLKEAQMTGTLPVPPWGPLGLHVNDLCIPTCNVQR